MIMMIELSRRPQIGDTVHLANFFKITRISSHEVRNRIMYEKFLVINCLLPISDQCFVLLSPVNKLMQFDETGLEIDQDGHAIVNEGWMTVCVDYSELFEE